MANYTVSDYLLDRVNIEDTITRMMWYVDRQEWELLSSLFAEELVMDYTALLGGEPTHTNGVDQAQVWRGMLEYIDSTIHVAAGILVDLPQPAADEPSIQPMETSCTCNFLITLMRYAAHGDPITQSGGHYAFKLVRSGDATGNFWRISYMKANMTFMKGNTDVAKNPKTNIGWL